MLPLATVLYRLKVTVQESLANARVTRDSSACMKAPKEEIKDSRKPRPITKHHVDRQTCCKVMAIFVYPAWPPAPYWIFDIRKLHH